MNHNTIYLVYRAAMHVLPATAGLGLWFAAAGFRPFTVDQRAAAAHASLLAGPGWLVAAACCRRNVLAIFAVMIPALIVVAAVAVYLGRARRPRVHEYGTVAATLVVALAVPLLLQGHQAPRASAFLLAIALESLAIAMGALALCQSGPTVRLSRWRTMEAWLGTLVGGVSLASVAQDIPP